MLSHLSKSCSVGIPSLQLSFLQIIPKPLPNFQTDEAFKKQQNHFLHAGNILLSKHVHVV